MDKSPVSFENTEPKKDNRAENKTDDQSMWSRFQQYYISERSLGFSLDVSRIRFNETIFNHPAISKAFADMSKLEQGAISNPDEKRMVGHYWLRAPELAPDAQIRDTISKTLFQIKDFAGAVHSGQIAPAAGKRFTSALVVGIGGSALGPQFVYNALRDYQQPFELFFFDNTDPDGMAKVLESIGDVSQTLCIVISKSGGTKETRNGQLIAKKYWEKRGLSPSTHFVAVTGNGSELDKTALSEKWLARFPMWDWVGGRTSELSAVGLLPAALHGVNVDEMLKGARDMDLLTRVPEARKNPGMLLALMWHQAGKGRGLKDMVVLPYKDRLELFSRYLQQLVMESLGKELDLDNKVVEQGIAVYGNKGSTDQHAYVQQLRDGVNNFFVVFVEVLKDRSAFAQSTIPFESEVEEGITSGDFLQGFLVGTRKALYEKSRESVTITIRDVNAHGVGMLIALFERAVGYYASLININAYHQPGVEAGKKAAGAVLSLQKKILSILGAEKSALSVDQIAERSGDIGNAETIFKVLRHLGENGRVKIEAGDDVFLDRYRV